MTLALSDEARAEMVARYRRRLEAAAGHLPNETFVKREDAIKLCLLAFEDGILQTVRVLATREET